MKFSIITPTHNRPKELANNILSISNFTSSDFFVEHIIINDSPLFDYAEVENTLIKAYIEEATTNPFYKIKYSKNFINQGVNHSRNIALKMVTGDYVILLDDDDWFAPDALLHIYHVLTKKELSGINWLVTNRTYANGKSLTHNGTNKNYVSYFFDYMVFKKFSGDATHIIKSNIAKRAHFAKNTKQGEEFYFFLQLPDKFLYKNLNTTITDGYNIGGLTGILKSKYKNNTWDLWKEKLNFKFFVYMVYRTIGVLKSKYF